MTERQTDDPDLGHQPRPTARALPIALLRTREHVMASIRPMLARAGVTEQKWRVLRILAESGPMEPTAIAHEACLLLPSLTRILAAMEDEALIARTRHTEDRRRSVIAISPAGRALVQARLAESEALYARLEQGFGHDRLELLLDLLEELRSVEL